VRAGAGDGERKPKRTGVIIMPIPEKVKEKLRQIEEIDQDRLKTHEEYEDKMLYLLFKRWQAQQEIDVLEKKHSKDDS